MVIRKQPSQVSIAVTDEHYQSQAKKLTERIAERWSVDFDSLAPMLRNKFSNKGKQPSNEQLFHFCFLIWRYDLDPFTNELHAFCRGESIIPIIGFDGMITIAHRSPLFDGIEYEQSDVMVEPDPINGMIHTICPEWIEAIVYVTSRSKPTRVREYLDECYVAPKRDQQGKPFMGPWQTHTKHMLRIKVTKEALRLGIGLHGLYDEDDAARIIESDSLCDTSNAETISFDSAPKLEQQKQHEILKQKIVAAKETLLQTERQEKPATQATPEKVPKNEPETPRENKGGGDDEYDDFLNDIDNDARPDGF